MPVIVSRHEYGNAEADAKITELTLGVFVGEGYSNPEMAHVFSPAMLRERGVTWIATVGNELAGTILLVDATSRFRQSAVHPEAEIHLLAVSPRHRGAHVGTALVEALTAHARSRKVPVLVLSSQPTMKAAHALYLGAGFTRAPARDWVRGDKVFWVFTRTLDPSLVD